MARGPKATLLLTPARALPGALYGPPTDFHVTQSLDRALIGCHPTEARRRGNTELGLGIETSLYAEIRRASLLVVALVAFAPAISRAEIVVITFDNGSYDPDIVSPGGQLHGPFDWLEGGTRSMGFWAINVGTVDGGFQLGHTHPRQSFSSEQDGNAQELHAWTGDLQGLYVSLEDGSRFDVVSIDYNLKLLTSEEPQMERYAWSFAPEDPQLLLARSFDPSLSNIEGQWTAFDLPHVQYTPWLVRPISGFDNVGGVWITSSLARLYIDTIILDVHRLTPSGATPGVGSQVPLSPSAAVILALSLAATGAAVTRRQPRHGGSG